MGIGKLELVLLIILVIIVLFTGGKKLPELARGVGEAAREFRDGLKGDKNTKNETKDSDKKA